MRVQELRLSNILSFEYKDDITNAFAITFDEALNIIIGGNGSGKSTALEAMNFVFRRVLFRHYSFNNSHFNDPRASQKKSSLTLDSQTERISPFRLQPNWQTEGNKQIIQVDLVLDAIDKDNIQKIIDNQVNIKSSLERYSGETMPDFSSINGNEVVTITVELEHSNDKYGTTYDSTTSDHIKFYLEEYNLINDAISIHNGTATTQIDTLNSTFSMLSAFRNYTSFSLNTSLQSDPNEQIRNLRGNNANTSNNSGGEPQIFNLIKIRLGEYHFELTTKEDAVESAIEKVNKHPLVEKINRKLQIVNLKLSIAITNVRSWTYEFKFTDTKHTDRDMGDINNLSAGQKSIIHLIFEAYGQDDMKGGVVIIDEPEIHLHYQYQYEYLNILEELTKELNTQFIIVTHSEGFISSSTAPFIKRFALDDDRHSTIFAPKLTTAQKKLVEILDNTQSARALFANKIVLVEGPGDEYFFRAAFKNRAPEVRQDVAIYNVGSKENLPAWKDFFEALGLIVYQVKDLDATQKDLYDITAKSLNDETKINTYKTDHADLTQKIDDEYKNGIFYLKNGALEQYVGIPKGRQQMKKILEFCDKIDEFFKANTDNSNEVTKIISTVINEN